MFFLPRRFSPHATVEPLQPLLVEGNSEEGKGEVGAMLYGVHKLRVKSFFFGKVLVL